MLTAALVPDTPLLVPGVSGRAEVLTGLRAAAVRAAATVVAAEPEVVVVVAPGRADRELTGPFAASLAAAGVPDTALGWPAEVVAGLGGPAGQEPTARPASAAQPTLGPTPAAGSPPAVAPAGLGANVALLLLAQAGWTGPVRVIEVGPAAGRSDAASGAAVRAEVGGDGPDGDGVGHDGAGCAGAETGGPAAALRERGATLAARHRRLGLVVVGSLSARHGPDGPLADDPRALGVDARLLTDLADGGPAARARLADVDAGLAAELAISGWGPWQVLLGAIDGDGGPVRAELLAAEAPFGAQYLVAAWAPGGRR